MLSVLAVRPMATLFPYTTLFRSYASFTFQVQDGGGTAGGGVDLDPTPRTLTLDVTSVNDAPAGTDRTVRSQEHTAETQSHSDLVFRLLRERTDKDLVAVTISTLP